MIQLMFLLKKKSLSSFDVSSEMLFSLSPPSFPVINFFCFIFSSSSFFVSCSFDIILFLFFFLVFLKHKLFLDSLVLLGIRQIFVCPLTCGSDFEMNSFIFLNLLRHNFSFFLWLGFRH